MPKIPTTIIFLFFLLSIGTDARAAATKPKVVIAACRDEFSPGAPLGRPGSGFFAKYGIDPQVLYMRGEGGSIDATFLDGTFSRKVKTRPVYHHEPSDGSQEKLSSAPAGDRRKRFARAH